MVQQPVFPSSNVKVTSILGASVVNPGQVGVGKIQEVLIDPIKGIVAHAAISLRDALAFDAGRRPALSEEN